MSDIQFYKREDQREIVSESKLVFSKTSIYLIIDGLNPNHRFNQYSCEGKAQLENNLYILLYVNSELGSY